MSDAPACGIRDRAGPMFDVDSLELRKCNSFEINTALNEFERKHPNLSHRFETWPDVVRLRFAKLIDEWTACHPHAVLKLTSTGLHQGVCVVILHYAEK